MTGHDISKLMWTGSLPTRTSHEPAEREDKIPQSRPKTTSQVQNPCAAPKSPFQEFFESVWIEGPYLSCPACDSLISVVKYDQHNWQSPKIITYFSVFISIITRPKIQSIGTRNDTHSTSKTFLPVRERAWNESMAFDTQHAGDRM